jgi:hypothetical protein
VNLKFSSKASIQSSQHVQDWYAISKPQSPYPDAISFMCRRNVDSRISHVSPSSWSTRRPHVEHSLVRYQQRYPTPRNLSVHGQRLPNHQVKRPVAKARRLSERNGRYLRSLARQSRTIRLVATLFTKHVEYVLHLTRKLLSITPFRVPNPIYRWLLVRHTNSATSLLRCSVIFFGTFEVAST